MYPFDDPISTLATTALPKRNPFGTPPTPEEEEGFLSKAGRAALGGLGFVGGTLDKLFGGRAIRGVLGGKPGELLSLIPGSDVLGITDEANRVSGEDLLKNWGVLEGEGEKGTLELRDFAGPALEMLLDPGSFLTTPLGSLTKAGVAAKKAGTLAPTLAQRIRQGEASLFGLGLPFMNPSIPLGTGERSIKIAEQLGKLYDKGLYSYPGRVLSSLFDPAAGGVTDELVQRESRALAPPRRAAEVEAERAGLAASRKLQEAGALTPDVGKDLYDIREGVLPPYKPATKTITEPGGWTTTLTVTDPKSQAMDDVVADLARLTDPAQAREAALGLPSKKIDYYAARTMHPALKEEKIASGALVPQPTSPHLIARRPEFEGLPTSVLQEMSQNPLLSGVGKTGDQLLEESKLIRNQYLGMDPAQEAARFKLNQRLQRAGTVLSPEELSQYNAIQRRIGSNLNPPSEAEMALLDEMAARIGSVTDQIGKVGAALDVSKRFGIGNVDNLQKLYDDVVSKLPLTPDELTEATRLNDLYKQSEGLASFMAQLSPKARETGLFSNDYITAATERLARGGKLEQKAHLIHNVLAKSARPLREAPSDWVPMTDVLRKAGITEEAAAKDTAIKKLLEFNKSYKKGGAIEEMVVSPDTERALTRYVQGFTQPETLSPFINAWDSLNALFKAGTTALWPKTRVRNLVQGLFQNFVRTDPGNWLQSTKDAYNVVRHGGVIEDAAKIIGQNLPADQATKALADEYAAFNGFFLGRSQRAAEEVGDISKIGKLPGEGQEGVLEILKSAIPKSKAEANPFAIAGVGGRKETTFAPVVASRKLDDLIDETNRFGLYLAKRREGYGAEQAFEEVIKAHYDFKDATQFEKSVMRRLVPFYSWTKNNLPRTLEEIATRPSGGTAMALKATERSRQDQGFLPEYVGEGLAIPIGKEEDGTQRYLAKLGLNYEDAFKPLAGGGRAALSELNPLIKMGLEFATGRQLQTGRRLEDLYQFPTGSPVVNEILANLPVTRFISTARTLGDERKDALTKAINLLSPASLTDVDMNKQKEVALRNVVDQMLAGDKKIGRFEKIYPKKEALATLTPEEIQALRLYTALEKKKQKEAKEKKQKTPVTD